MCTVQIFSLTLKHAHTCTVISDFIAICRFSCSDRFSSLWIQLPKIDAFARSFVEFQTFCIHLFFFFFEPWHYFREKIEFIMKLEDNHGPLRWRSPAGYHADELQSDPVLYPTGFFFKYIISFYRNSKNNTWKKFFQKYYPVNFV